MRVLKKKRGGVFCGWILQIIAWWARVMVVCFSIYYYTFSRETHSWEWGQEEKKLWDKQPCTLADTVSTRHLVHTCTHTCVSFLRLNYTLIKYVIKNSTWEMNGGNKHFLNKINSDPWSLHRHTHSYSHTYRTVPAVRSVTVSSRPDRGLWFETVQPTVSLSYLPDGLVWPGVTLARSLCLFSVCFSPSHTSTSSLHAQKHEHVFLHKVL